MTPVPACTIVSNNYLALARVLAESYRQHHPGARVFVCVVDRAHAAVDYAKLPFETVFVEDLGIADLRGLAFGLGILELNTAVKPFLLEFLRERFALERVFYLDPDILVLDRLEALEAALTRGPMVLTPHITAPLDDARQPSERLILLSGVYNLGFVGLRLDATTAPFLRWWQARLRRFCLHDVEHGLFVDQSWMDLAPALLPDVQIARDDVFNVAYWNLAHRRPVCADGRWRIERRALGFFHFSGLPLHDLERVSRYQDRIRLAERPELRPLFERYRELLLAAGHDELRQLPYAFARFDDGRPVPDVARRVRQRVDPQGARWADPFAVGPDGFAAWLSEPLAFPGGVLTRLALALWEESAELRTRFGDPCGADLVPFLAHLRDGGATRAGLPREWWDGLGGALGGATPVVAPMPVTSGAPTLRLDFARPGALTAWLNEALGPPSARPLVTRLALHVHALRADARQVYPEPLGRDRRAFAYWFAVIGADEMGVADALVAPVRRSLGLRARLSLALRRTRRKRAERASRPAPAPPVAAAAAGPARVLGAALPGVNLVGRFDAEDEDAALARGARAALRAAGVALTELALDRDPHLDVARGAYLPPHGLPHGLTIVHVGPHELPQVLARLPLAGRAGGRVVGYWLWPLAHFPLALRASFAGLDEVWVPNRFVADALRALAPVPVHVVEPALEALPHAPPGEQHAEARFLAAFEAHAGDEASCTQALLAAFERAVARSARPLRLSLHAAQAGAELWERLERRVAGLPVTLERCALSRHVFAAQLARCDAFVSLARAESLGMLGAQALAWGKPVIATAVGGTSAWLDAQSGFPVETRPVSLTRDWPPLPQGALWAEADVDSASSALLSVAEQPAEAARRAFVGRERVRLLFDVTAAGQRWARECARLGATGRPAC